MINIIELKQGGDCDTITLKIDNNLEIEISNFDDEITIDINKITIEGELIENKSSSSFVKATEQLNDLN